MTREQVTSAVAVAEMISRELDEDYVGLWTLPWHLRRALPEASDSDIRDLAGAIIRGLESSGVVVGDLAEDSGVFSPWERGSAVEVVMLRWSELGRDPNIGEIAYLARAR